MEKAIENRSAGASHAFVYINLPKDWEGLDSIIIDCPMTGGGFSFMYKGEQLTNMRYHLRTIVFSSDDPQCRECRNCVKTVEEMVREKNVKAS